jgi:hypothetical protein
MEDIRLLSLVAEQGDSNRLGALCATKAEGKGAVYEQNFLFETARGG